MDTPTVTPVPQLLWTPRTAATACGYQSPISVLRAFRRGELAGYKLNSRTVRFAPDDVRRWLARARVAKLAGADRREREEARS
jgi:hypothetical protein